VVLCREREETIADKDRRIFDLKKRNQELEKFKVSQAWITHNHGHIVFPGHTCVPAALCAFLGYLCTCACKISETNVAVCVLIATCVCA
jgi:hypothetical protein